MRIRRSRSSRVVRSAPPRSIRRSARSSSISRGSTASRPSCAPTTCSVRSARRSARRDRRRNSARWISSIRVTWRSWRSRNGAQHFSLVSALGASSKSGVFYSRVKGELEDALRAMGWPSLCLLRPSVIAGDRQESRPLERLSEALLRFGPATYRPVAAGRIAAAMIATAQRERSRRHDPGVARDSPGCRVADCSAAGCAGAWNHCSFGTNFLSAGSAS